MKNMKQFISQTVYFLIFLFFVMNVVMAMENKIFPEFCVEFSTHCLSECDSIRQISITPDLQNALIAEKEGVVSCVSFADRKKTELIRIPRVTYLPLVSSATKQGSLLVAAAGNYFDREECVNKAECHIWHESIIKRFVSAPLQAITLDKNGHLLVMVTQAETVAVRNLDTNQLVVRSLWTEKAPEYDIDIVCDDQGNIIIVAKEHSITVVKWNGVGLEIIQRHNSWEDHIERVFLPQSDALVYRTRENIIKKIELSKMLDKVSKPIVMFEAMFSSEISIDEDNDKIVVLWTKDKNNTDYLQRQIVVRKKGKKDKDDYIFLMTQPFSAVYDYLTTQGTKRAGRNYVREVAIRGNSVVALTADGKFYRWIIDNLINIKKEKKQTSIHVFDNKMKDKSKNELKDRSKTSVPHLLLPSDGPKNLITPKTSKITSNKDEVMLSSGIVPLNGRSNSDPYISPRRNVSQDQSSGQTLRKSRGSSPIPTARSPRRDNRDDLREILNTK